MWYTVTWEVEAARSEFEASLGRVSPYLEFEASLAYTERTLFQKTIENRLNLMNPCLRFWIPSPAPHKFKTNNQPTYKTLIFLETVLSQRNSLSFPSIKGTHHRKPCRNSSSGSFQVTK
jgi:hypothetical protein